ncbi:MAG: TlpA disulfide reductase family protein [Pirellulaceae bacterium]|jgi:thiol-disulfide isomerase/thioredoxin|nr:TlpA disulfide reductase family protein [Pirellulaceae bacterium]
MSRHWFAFLSCCLMLLAMGCGADSGDVVQNQPPQESSDPPDESSAVVAETKSWEEVQQWVKAQEGKVVVVDVWSTSCATCMAEFPHFVELANAKSSAVACASLSIDYYGGNSSPEDARGKIEKFLTSQQSIAANFISTDTDEDVLKAIDAASIPIALVYDQQGDLNKVFHNLDGEYGAEGFSYEQHINPLVEQLLAGDEGE